MDTLFGIPIQALSAQLMLGLVNGSFYAMLSLGLAVIFGMLQIINFAHGAQYMLGAMVTWMLLTYLGIGYWYAMIIAPIAVGVLGFFFERLLLSKLYNVDHLYGLLLTFGTALVISGVFQNIYGVTPQPYPSPSLLSGGADLGFMYMPYSRLFVLVMSILVCLATWLLVEKTAVGSYLRAATENPSLVRAFGINVPLLVSLTYAFGVGLAALAGVLAAPIYSVYPNMGDDIMIVVFAVVVIGGMGSIGGAIISGFALGILEGITRVIYPELSATIIFIAMAGVLLLRPNGLFGRA